MDIPATFDVHFLEWIRERTTAQWAVYHTKPFEGYVATHATGPDWQQGTRWLGGLTAEQVAQVERRWSVRFPPDYALFLRHLHTVDRPAIDTYFVATSRMAQREEPTFTNWLNPSEVQQAFDKLVNRVFVNGVGKVWLNRWGDPPASRVARRKHVEQLIASAPRLIPLLAHRYLVSEPCQAGNPVLSIWPGDSIVYASNLHDFFLVELAEVLDIPFYEPTITRTAIDIATSMPFWGDLLFGYDEA